MEPLSSRIIRHIIRGEFPVQKGARSLINIIEARGIDVIEPRQAEEDKDYFGVKGLIYTQYVFEVPLPLSRKIGLFPIEIVTFPADSSLKVYATPSNSPTINTNSFLEYCAHGIAEFTGPTFLAKPPYDKLPNNGFFLLADDGSIISTPFSDTNPSGLRKGAITIDDQGKTRIIQDQEKWDLVRNGFPNHKAVIGTSFFFTDKDSIYDLKEIGSKDIDNASYIISFEREKHTSFLAFLHTRREMTLTTIKRVIDLHCQLTPYNGYIAAELELRNTNCTVRHPSGSLHCLNLKGGFYGRRDHYVIER